MHELLVFLSFNTLDVEQQVLPGGMGQAASGREKPAQVSTSMSITRMILRMRRCCRRLRLLVVILFSERVVNTCGQLNAKARDSLIRMH